MKFAELKRCYEEKKDFDKCGLNILKYIPLSQKCDSITDDMLNTVVEIKDNFMSVYNLNYKLFTMAILAKFYCEIEFDDGITTDDYDFLYQNKFKLWLKRVTEGDSYLFISDFFNRELENKIARYNSIGNAFDLINKQGLFDIKNLGESMEELKNINPETVKIFEKIQELNKVKENG